MRRRESVCYQSLCHGSQTPIGPTGRDWRLNLISRGSDYTIADIAIRSWYGRLAQDKVWDRAGIFLNVKKNISICRLGQRNHGPAVKRETGSKL